MNSSRETLNPKRKKSCEAQPTSQINGKAEYPWREGNALYLVGLPFFPVDAERPRWNTVHIRTGYQKLA